MSVPVRATREISRKVTQCPNLQQLRFFILYQEFSTKRRVDKGLSLT